MYSNFFLLLFLVSSKYIYSYAYQYNTNIRTATRALYAILYIYVHTTVCAFTTQTDATKTMMFSQTQYDIEPHKQITITSHK